MQKRRYGKEITSEQHERHADGQQCLSGPTTIDMKPLLIQIIPYEIMILLIVKVKNMKHLQKQLFWSLLELQIITEKKDCEDEICEKEEMVREHAKSVRNKIINILSKNKAQTVALDTVIEPPEYQDQIVNQHYLVKLEYSIKTYGLKNPIIVRKSVNGYPLIQGYPRYLVCKKLDVRSVPVKIVDTLYNDSIEELLLIDPLCYSTVSEYKHTYLNTVLKYYNTMLH